MNIKKFTIRYLLLMLIVIVLSIVFLIFFSGCLGKNMNDKEVPQYEVLKEQNVSFVLGNRANSLAAPTEDTLGMYVLASYNAGYVPSITTVEGRPKSKQNIKGDIEGPSDIPDGKSRLMANRKPAYNLTKKILNDLNLSSTSEEVDIFSAISEAATCFSSNTNNFENTIVIFDSGINTCGCFDMRESYNLSIVESDEDAINSISAQLPNLSNIDNVYWYGFNNVDENFQSKMSYSLVDNIVKVYEKLLKNAGVKNVVKIEQKDPNQNKSDIVIFNKQGLPNVSQIKFTNEDIKRGVPIELNNAVLRFKPNTSDFEDENLAKQTLGSIAEQVIANNYNVSIDGYVSIQDGGQPPLSQKRADKVKELLIRLGCNGDNITAIGRGKGTKPDIPGQSENPENRCIILNFN